jgi:hypothetical protein
MESTDESQLRENQLEVRPQNCTPEVWLQKEFF